MVESFFSENVVVSTLAPPISVAERKGAPRNDCTSLCETKALYGIHGAQHDTAACTAATSKYQPAVYLLLQHARQVVKSTYPPGRTSRRKFPTDAHTCTLLLIRTRYVLMLYLRKYQLFFFYFASHLSSLLYSLLHLSPFRNSDRRLHSGHSSPLPTAVHVFISIAEILCTAPRNHHSYE